MKRILSFAVVVLMLSSLGCTPPKPEDQKKIVIMIRTTSKAATEYGLNVLDKKDHKAAATTADEANKAIVEVVLPYLNSEAISATSFAVNELLRLKFFDNLSEDIKLAIVAACAVLDTYITPPDPAKHLTKEELDYMKAFFEGVAAGTDDFRRKPMGIPSPSTATKKGVKWFQ